MNRRDFLLTTTTGAAFASLGAAAAHAEMAMSPGEKPVSPMQWTDENGLTRFLKHDTDPLNDEFAKYPRCPYCGMMRQMYSHSRHLIVYGNDTVDGTCSLHCAAISLSLNMDAGPKAIYAGDAGAEGEVKPLADTAAMTYVIDPAKPGTMTAVSKWAYADAAKAEEAASKGAKTATFEEALTLAYLDMAKDTLAIRKRRGEKRKQMGMEMPSGN
ncbi:NosL protein [Rhodobacter aestuarii]|uniref:NosL protein n=1 Tax=Rhodobacter aestuarii TaxID=453582 RepID=A0A1N7J2H5_9RHOB|nr:nitrous oxide reductase accessory protein NosL [Rhodobacter aestuarii]PTV97260.1 NosL protein [Rhodobacter aestuarii]SIS43504.1 NosL protein [Rhodobacter aestuarii]